MSQICLGENSDITCNFNDRNSRPLSYSIGWVYTGYSTAYRPRAEPEDGMVNS